MYWFLHGKIMVEEKCVHCIRFAGRGRNALFGRERASREVPKFSLYSIYYIRVFPTHKKIWVFLLLLETQSFIAALCQSNSNTLICVASFETLHAWSTNKNGFKTLIAAEYNGVEVKLVQDFEMGVSNKTPEFLKMNPIGKVGSSLSFCYPFPCCV